MGKKIAVDKRREIISSFIHKKGFASVEDLNELVDVSRMTIHRDLDELEHLQIIHKVRNGASAQPSSVFETDYRYRKMMQVKEKYSVCKLASSLIKDGMSILVDESTTVYPLIEFLEDFQSLTIITASLAIIEKLRDFDNIKLIVIGGNFNQKYLANYGFDTIECINDIHPDILFMSSFAYQKGALYQGDTEILAVKRAIIDQASRKILLLDSKKLNRTALYKLAEIKIFEKIILDSSTSTKVVAELSTYNKNILIAKQT